MTSEEGMTRDDELLHAYHDGELSGFARWRFEQRLRRSPELQAALAALSSVGAALRDIDADGIAPDLWEDIALRLPGLDAQRDARAQPASPDWLAWLVGPLGAALATAAAAVGLAIAVYAPGGVPSGPALRWLDAAGHSVMVIDDESELTIIWLLDDASGAEAAGGVGEAV